MKRSCFIFPPGTSGFSLIELIVVFAIFGILMTMVFSSFIPVLQRNSQQGRISETKLETGIGLDLLRADLEHAGFGLPWSFPVAPNPYNEPTAASAPVAINDAPNVPRPLSSLDATTFGLNNGSDYLSIKAMNVVRGTTSQKWGWLWRNAAHTATIQSMGAEPFDANDRVIVIHPRDNRRLVVDGVGLYNFSATTTSAALDNFAPDEAAFDPDGERFLLFGLDNINNPQRPFNRTDYYVNEANVPTQCAPGTGVLTKLTLNQGDNLFSFLPIVDCVADFQVVYYLDTTTPVDGGWDARANANGLNGMDAKEVRDRVKSIRCYILTHEGGADRSYTYPNQTINVGEVDQNGDPVLAADGTPTGRVFTLNPSVIGPTWSNYRWKVYSLAMTPKNLQ